MSRCFPYPPPGYVGSKASNDALIESIKLQRESEKAKAERKREKKREKREKRERKEKKAKKDDAKPYPSGAQDGKAQKSGGPDKEAHRNLADSKGIFKEKTKEVSDEQMERSGLTEEHERMVSVQKPSYSSDSTENSNKRKRLDSHPPNGGISGHGNVIRIRLPLGKHKEHNSVKESFCSTSGRTGFSTPLRKDSSPVQVHRLADKKQICSSSGADQELAPVDVPMPSALTAFEKELQAANLLYKELVGGFVSPATNNELVDLGDDQEWLFGRKQKSDMQGEKRHKPNSELSCRGSSLLQPHAQFLPEVGIYALPYTLPF